MQKKEFESKEEKLAKIKQNYKFNSNDGINTQTMEKLNTMGTTFYESGLEAVLIQHNDLVVITTTIGKFGNNQLMVNKGSTFSLQIT